MAFLINHDSSSDQKQTLASQLNWLRAAVLGANDGIVSVAGIVVGVAAASSNSHFILTAGLAGLVAGALSMGVGEYISVSSQRDTQKALIEKEKLQLAKHPENELKELTLLYQNKGLSSATASKVAKELTALDPIAAHAEAEYNVDINELNNPWHAALASSIAFALGAIIPVAAVTLTPAPIRIAAAFVAVVVALILTGSLSAWSGGANILRASRRVVIGGIVAMLVTYLIGSLFHVSGI